jgi:hypothetical protein
MIISEEVIKFCSENGYDESQALEKCNDFVNLLLDGKISLNSVNDNPEKFASVVVSSISDKTLKKFKTH